MRGAERASWKSFAERAQRSGLTCLAIDPRGQPGRADTLPDPGGSSPRVRVSLDQRLLDVDAAVHVLREKGANRDNIALVGAGMGADLVLHYAADRPDIPAIVLISPGLDRHGMSAEKTIVGMGTRPVLLMVASGDAYAASSARALKKAAPGFCELREYNGAAHGTDLLERSLQANEQILLWLSQIIGPAADTVVAPSP